MSDTDTARAPGLRTTLLLALTTAMLGGLVSAMAVMTFVRHNVMDVGPGGPVASDSRDISPEGVDDAPTVSMDTSMTGGALEVPASTSPDEAATIQAAAEERSQLAQSVVEISRRCERLEAQLEAAIARIESLEGIESALAARLDAAQAAAIVEENPEAFLPVVAEGDAAVQRGAGREIDLRAGLAAAGVDPMSIEDIGRRRDNVELARLELIDQATREGWRDSEQFEARLNELQSADPDLRAELGEEAYDRFLFESGGPNRVGVASIIGGSAAEMAGLTPGDIILSYGGERIYRQRDLQTATRSGARGEGVQLSIQRGTELISVEVPRGPLGVSLVSRRDAP